MQNMMNAVLKAITAGANYFVAACSVAISNPWFLILTILLLLSAGKSLKVGKFFAVKG